MTVTPLTQITHESETQRQHVRFGIAARAVCYGREYDVKDVSCGGVSIQGIKGEFTPGMAVPVSLRFPFEGFTFGLRLSGEVRHYSAETQVLGCRFVNLTAQQISFLTFIVKSFIAGDVISAGSLLNVSARNNMTKPRAAANQKKAPGLLRQLPGLAAVALLGFLILAVLGQNVYSSIFIIRSDDATVAGPTVPVRAAVNGQFRLALDPDLTYVKQNQMIGAITTGSGSTATIQSPCNCYISKTSVANGEIAAQGQKIMSLVPVDAVPWIEAELDPAQGKKIGPATRAEVSVFGSRTPYAGHVVSMDSSMSDSATGAHTARVKIALDQKLPVDFMDRLASVTFIIH
jgi:alginate biosynthesis protein Alg44